MYDIKLHALKSFPTILSHKIDVVLSEQVGTQILDVATGKVVYCLDVVYAVDVGARWSNLCQGSCKVSRTCPYIENILSFDNHVIQMSKSLAMHNRSRNSSIPTYSLRRVTIWKSTSIFIILKVEEELAI